jgi:hypothetical protein
MSILTNFLILALVLGMAYWWSTQGLFSATIHAVLTVLAGALGFALWEPLAVGLLLGFIPGYAWGVALVVPFALGLLGIRFLIDRLVPGNLDFHPLVNSIGGAVMGAFSGVIAAGMLMIGLQFIGPFDVPYHPWSINASNQLERTESLWIPVDDMTSLLYVSLSSGSLRPMDGQTLASHIPAPAQSAGLFQRGARKVSAHAIKPSAVQITGYREASAGAVRPLKREQIKLAEGRKLVIVTTQIGANQAADPDGVFTVAPTQLALMHSGPGGEMSLTPSMGYLYGPKGETFGPMRPGEYARSKSRVANATYHWMFIIEEGQKPEFIRLKQLRVEVPEQVTADEEETVEMLASVEWASQTEPESAPGAERARARAERSEAREDRPGEEVEMGYAEGAPAGAMGRTAKVSPKLPTVVSANDFNMLGNGQLRDNEVVSAYGTVPQATGRIGRELAVDQLHYDPQSSAIVQVRLDERNARSLYGRVREFSAQTQPPLLEDADGDTYPAIGYVRVTDSQLEMRIDTMNPIRSLSQIDMESMQPGNEMVLYFQVARGIEISEFRIGNASRQELSLRVP